MYSTFGKLNLRGDGISMMPRFFICGMVFSYSGLKGRTPTLQ